jgi:hypothetical protein
MKSYELIGTNHGPEAVEQISRVIDKLHFFGVGHHQCSAWPDTGNPCSA